MRRKCSDGHLKRLFLNLLFIYGLINQVAGLGQVEVVFKTISNPENKLTDGSTCRDTTCDIKMKVTFKEPALNSYKSKSFNMQGKLTLPQTGAGALNDEGVTEFDNPLNVSAPAQKKLKKFSVSVEVDDYSNYRKIPMGKLNLTEDVTTGIIYNRTLTDNYLTMTLSFKVICKKNYYYDCSVHCVGQDDNLGHFTCDPVTGGKVCLEGWTGDDCLTRICSKSMTVKGGRVASTPQTIYKENDTITIECEPEYQLNPHLQSNVLTCQSDGEWSFSDFTKICTERGCPGCSRLREPLHGRLSYLSQNTCHNAKTNSTVSVTCYPNYTPLVTYPGLRCGEQRQWVDVTGTAVQEGKKRLLDCIAAGDSEIDESEDALKRRLAKNAMVIGTLTLFTFFAIIFLYFVLYRRREKKRKVSPRRKSYVPEEVQGRLKTLKCAGIGDTGTKIDISPVINDHGPVTTVGYVNHGFDKGGFDYEF